MLKLRNLRAGYGKIEALHGVSLHVQEGEIVTLIGANGAGKTTLLNAVSGLVPATAGSLEFRGESILGLSSEQIVRRGLCQVPEGRQVFSAMTVAANLLMGGFIHRRNPEQLREDMEVRLLTKLENSVLKFMITPVLYR